MIIKDLLENLKGIKEQVPSTFNIEFANDEVIKSNEKQ